MSGNIEINSLDKNKSIQLLSEKKDFYSGSFDKNIDLILDDFQGMIEQNVLNVDILMDCKITNMNIINNTIIGSNEVNKLLLNDNEGVGFENQIWAVFDDIFKPNLYKNPRIQESNKQRELTDILSFYKLGIFLIEVKAMGVFSVEENITEQRKVANLKKQISKGIKQLIGARRALEKQSKIIDNKNNEIVFDKNIFPHCLVIVSELLQFGDWEEIEMLMLKAMLENNLCLNVLDLVELMKYIKISNGKKEMFDYYMLERRDRFIENGADIHIRAKFVNKDEDIKL
ncbi:hypothetical protein [uncultured Flavobacterium sp.]|uniref:hypothetical protein n=1 Tax=uncultured Flavobacterium sp. TaxID=165435 RepID=UPI0025FC5528|nr:hypothetical protein [uncultured Flavobacterium sp.]